MREAFMFEAENENYYPQGEYSYEDFEGDYEGADYEAEAEDFEDYEYGDNEADFEGDYEGDYEAENEQEYADLEMADEFRGRGRMVPRPMGFRPARRFVPFRGNRPAIPFRRFAGRAPFGFRPRGYFYRRPYRWIPGRRRFPFGSVGFQPGAVAFGGGGLPQGASGLPADSGGQTAEPSNLVMMLQRLLNRALGTNLPVDGVMSVETRSALRSFQSQADAPPTPSSPPPPPTGGTDTNATPPQAEYDELAFLESEFDEYGY